MSYQKDLAESMKYKQGICQASSKYNIDPHILAGVMSRESNMGRALDRNGLGDKGNGFGLMQVDKRSHTPRGGPYSDEHISQGAEILRHQMDRVNRDHPGWSDDQKLRGGIAAYNFDAKNVRNPDKIDVGTTGGNYSSDVMKRADYFKQNGYTWEQCKLK